MGRMVCVMGLLSCYGVFAVSLAGGEGSVLALAARVVSEVLFLSVHSSRSDVTMERVMGYRVTYVSLMEALFIGLYWARGRAR
eukprot:765594-Hanusia_phi.AAC.4